MKIIKSHLTILFIFLICQGCASNPTDISQKNNAKFLDLGDGICRQSNGLMWQIGKTEKLSSFEEAEKYVKNMELGGYNDWRVPTKNELYTLCDLFEQKLAGDCPLKHEGSYWSKNGKGEAGEWHSYPLCGGSDFEYLKSKTGRVRAVRP
ncbi:MAG: DUF1566 domain-containing protein [Desulfobulbaceae bacterium]|uniref:DUF1566 domain-containing protein n=1 Tax=Candidatus Desulfobia pelagia TaxID=2841692 RepID=A0A8J6TF66_9BACT|nr:DUF1566 domain-containing protein [Candidatus Desulfobia pelagia]